MFVDISPPAGTRVVGAQVARGRRHGREAGLGTWVCERRVRQKLRPTACGETVEWGAAEELRAPGQRLKDMNIYSHEYAVYAYDTG